MCPVMDKIAARALLTSGRLAYLRSSACLEVAGAGMQSPAGSRAEPRSETRAREARENFGKGAVTGWRVVVPHFALSLAD